MDISAAIGLLMTPAGRRNPYPAYAALHAYGPAIGLSDQVIVHSYEHANAVLRDPSMRVVDRDLVTRRFGQWFADRPAQRLLNDWPRPSRRARSCWATWPSCCWPGTRRR